MNLQITVVLLIIYLTVASSKIDTSEEKFVEKTRSEKDKFAASPRKIDCTIHTFAPKCRGIWARKRDTRRYEEPQLEDFQVEDNSNPSKETLLETLMRRVSPRNTYFDYDSSSGGRIYAN